jgi:SAM-dependent methyltransferase
MNSSRVYLEKAIAEFVNAMQPGSLVLDLGAGVAPYSELFTGMRYESADFEKVDKVYGQSTYVCDICERIPVDDCRFNYVLSTQVLEHLKEPLKALGEVFRVLAPGGLLMCTCPLFYEEHEKPYDFFRYTQFAHRYMFGSVGFEIEKLDWLEGFFGTCGYMMETIYKSVPGHVSGSSVEAVLATAFLRGFKPITLAAAAAFYRMDLSWKLTNTGFPKNYVIWARKPNLP